MDRMRPPRFQQHLLRCCLVVTALCLLAACLLPSKVQAQFLFTYEINNKDEDGQMPKSSLFDPSAFKIVTPSQLQSSYQKIASSIEHPPQLQASTQASSSSGSSGGPPVLASPAPELALPPPPPGQVTSLQQPQQSLDISSSSRPSPLGGAGSPSLLKQTSAALTSFAELIANLNSPTSQQQSQRPSPVSEPPPQALDQQDEARSLHEHWAQQQQKAHFQSQSLVSGSAPSGPNPAFNSFTTTPTSSNLLQQQQPASEQVRGHQQQFPVASFQQASQQSSDKNQPGSQASYWLTASPLSPVDGNYLVEIKQNQAQQQVSQTSTASLMDNLLSVGNPSSDQPPKQQQSQPQQQVQLRTPKPSSANFAPTTPTSYYPGPSVVSNSPSRSHLQQQPQFPATPAPAQRSNSQRLLNQLGEQPNQLLQGPLNIHSAVGERQRSAEEALISFRQQQQHQSSSSSSPSSSGQQQPEQREPTTSNLFAPQQPRQQQQAQLLRQPVNLPSRQQQLQVQQPQVQHPQHHHKQQHSLDIPQVSPQIYESFLLQQKDQHEKHMELLKQQLELNKLLEAKQKQQEQDERRKKMKAHHEENEARDLKRERLRQAQIKQQELEAKRMRQQKIEQEERERELNRKREEERKRRVAAEEIARRQRELAAARRLQAEREEAERVRQLQLEQLKARRLREEAEKRKLEEARAAEEAAERAKRAELLLKQEELRKLLEARQQQQQQLAAQRQREREEAERAASLTSTAPSTTGSSLPVHSTGRSRGRSSASETGAVWGQPLSRIRNRERVESQQQHHHHQSQQSQAQAPQVQAQPQAQPQAQSSRSAALASDVGDKFKDRVHKQRNDKFVNDKLIREKIPAYSGPGQYGLYRNETALSELTALLEAVTLATSSAGSSSSMSTTTTSTTTTTTARPTTVSFSDSLDADSIASLSPLLVRSQQANLLTGQLEQQDSRGANANANPNSLFDDDVPRRPARGLLGSAPATAPAVNSVWAARPQTQRGRTITAAEAPSRASPANSPSATTTVTSRGGTAPVVSPSISISPAHLSAANNTRPARIGLASLPPDSDQDGIPGRAGVEYPVLAQVPPTSFSCAKQPLNGYYADTETACQVVHLCQGGSQSSILCPNGTIFNQEKFSCQWWYEVNCSRAPNFYQLNDNLYKLSSASGNSDMETTRIKPSSASSDRLQAL